MSASFTLNDNIPRDIAQLYNTKQLDSSVACSLQTLFTLTNQQTAGYQTVTIRAAIISSVSSNSMAQYHHVILRCRLKVFISCHDAICIVGEAYVLAVPSIQHPHITVRLSVPWTAPWHGCIRTTDSSLTQKPSLLLLQSRLGLSQDLKEANQNCLTLQFNKSRLETSVVLICCYMFIWFHALSKEPVTSFTYCNKLQKRRFVMALSKLQFCRHKPTDI